MKIIFTDKRSRPPSQKLLARVSGVMEFTIRSNVHSLLMMALQKGWTLKKGVKVYP